MLGIGRSGDIARDPEQGTECVKRVEAPVKAEGEFVEIGLQVLRTDAVVDAAQPGFEIGEHEMDDGQKGFRDFHVAALGDGGVKVPALPECRIAAPVVGNNGRARCHCAFDEADQRLCAPVRNHGEADAPGVPPGLPLVEAAGCHKRLR